MYTNLGQRIANFRHEKHLRQEDLAEILGVSPQAVSKWENDQTCPDISLLPSLAKQLGVSVDELLTGKKEEPPTVKILPEHERKDIKDMILRIAVKSTDGNVVRINLPLAILEVALESGLGISQLSNNDTLKNIDLGKILNMVKQGAIGNLIDVESADGNTVQIFVE